MTMYDNDSFEHPLRARLQRLLKTTATLTSGFGWQNSIAAAHERQDIDDDIARTTAVCCFFGAEPKDPLMWAHYGDNHRGFCTEYRGRLQPPLHRVNYVTIWPPQVDIWEILLIPEIVTTRAVTTKRSSWAHKHEYRLIHLNMVDEKSGGVLLDLPETLEPVRLIHGARVEEQSDEHKLLQRLAAKLDIPLDRPPEELVRANQLRAFAPKR